MSVEKKPAGNGTFAVLYCAIFRTPRFRKSLKFFGTSIASLDPETVQLPAFSILSAMFTGGRGPPEKISLPLVLRLNVLRMIVKLAYLALSHPPWAVGTHRSNLWLWRANVFRLEKHFLCKRKQFCREVETMEEKGSAVRNKQTNKQTSSSKAGVNFLIFFIERPNRKVWDASSPC